jgi:hypothetical protein
MLSSLCFGLSFRLQNDYSQATSTFLIPTYLGFQNFREFRHPFENLRNTVTTSQTDSVGNCFEHGQKSNSTLDSYEYNVSLPSFNPGFLRDLGQYSACRA